MASAACPINIFNYSSVTEFLEDAYSTIHAKNPEFSYQSIADQCGFKSRTLARNLIKGATKPTRAQLQKLAEVIGLDDQEQSYLLGLAQFSEVRDQKAAYELFQRLL